MIKLYEGGAYLLKGSRLVTDEAALAAECGAAVSREEAVITPVRQ